MPDLLVGMLVYVFNVCTVTYYMMVCILMIYNCEGSRPPDELIFLVMGQGWRKHSESEEAILYARVAREKFCEATPTKA